jgi:hypothetical protein
MVGDGISSDRFPVLQGTLVDSSYRWAAEVRCLLLRFMFLSTLSTGLQICYHYRAELVLRPLHAFTLEQRQMAITCYYNSPSFNPVTSLTGVSSIISDELWQNGTSCTSNIHTSLFMPWADITMRSPIPIVRHSFANTITPMLTRLAEVSSNQCCRHHHKLVVFRGIHRLHMSRQFTRGLRRYTWTGVRPMPTHSKVI